MPWTSSCARSSRRRRRGCTARTSTPFEVRSHANKAQIKEAVEKSFNVKVTTVNVMIMKGKPYRARGNHVKHRSNWKKAVVTLAAGDKLELFEGV